MVDGGWGLKAVDGVDGVDWVEAASSYNRIGLTTWSSCKQVRLRLRAQRSGSF